MVRQSGLLAGLPVWGFHEREGPGTERCGLPLADCGRRGWALGVGDTAVGAAQRSRIPKQSLKVVPAADGAMPHVCAGGERPVGRTFEVTIGWGAMVTSWLAIAR